MAITVNCQCGGRFRVGDQHAGKKIKCPKCSGGVEVPEPSEAAAEPVAAAPKKRETSKVMKGGAELKKREPVRYDQEDHRGDTVRLETSKIEVLSMKGVASKKKKDPAPVASMDEGKRLVIMVLVVVGLLIGAVIVGYHFLKAPSGNAQVAALPQNPLPPTGSQPPIPSDPNPYSAPVRPNPAPTPPSDVTPPTPIAPPTPSEPESLEDLVWPITELGVTPPEAVRKSATIPAKGSIGGELGSRKRQYDLTFKWEDGAIAGVDGWLEDSAGNRLEFKEFVFLTTKDKAFIEAAAEKGGNTPRFGSVKGGKLTIQFASGKGSLEVTFQDCRVTAAAGVAPTFTGEFAEIEQLRARQQAVSTLTGVLQAVSSEVRDLALRTAEAK